MVVVDRGCASDALHRRVVRLRTVPVLTVVRSQRTLRGMRRYGWGPVLAAILLLGCAETQQGTQPSADDANAVDGVGVAPDLASGTDGEGARDGAVGMPPPERPLERPMVPRVPPVLPPPMTVVDAGAPARQPPEPTPQPGTRLQMSLQGVWYRLTDIGDCINAYEVLTFAERGAANFQRLDDNACSGLVRGQVLPGEYELLDDNTLYLTYAGEGIPRPLDMAPSDAVLGRRHEIHTLAIAERSDGTGYVLDGRAFLQREPGHYVSRRELGIEDPNDRLLFDQALDIDLFIDPPPPLADGEVAMAHLRLQRRLYDAGAGGDRPDEMFEIDFEQVSVVRGDGVTELVARFLMGSQDVAGVWQQFLTAEGIEARSESFRRTFEGHAFPAYAYADGHPEVLTLAVIGEGQYHRTDPPPFALSP